MAIIQNLAAKQRQFLNMDSVLADQHQIGANRMPGSNLAILKTIEFEYAEAQIVRKSAQNEGCCMVLHTGCFLPAANVIRQENIFTGNSCC